MKAYLKVIHISQDPINKKASANYWLKKICSSNPELNQKSFYNTHSLFKYWDVNIPSSKSQIAWMIIKKVIVLAKYWDFADIFLKKIAAGLLKCFDINKYLIDLEPGK